MKNDGQDKLNQFVKKVREHREETDVSEIVKMVGKPDASKGWFGDESYVSESSSEVSRECQYTDMSDFDMYCGMPQDQEVQVAIDTRESGC